MLQADKLHKGATLDRYRIEAELGAGGMGRVYCAFDPRLQRRIALKLLLPRSDQGEAHEEAVARLLREARAAAALNHPNVVTVYDVGEAEGIPFIAMELAPGVSLNHYVNDASVPWLTRVRWLTDVARALSAAHRAGLIHRDVKPANVILREDGVIKVLDFGIARYRIIELDPLTPISSELEEISDSLRLGTPLYMSPEQLRGEPLDGRSDQFSWGVMAYELLAGKIPWEAVGSLSVIAMILGKDPGPIQAGPAGAQVSAEVAAVVMRALQKDMSARFGSMDELIAELEPWVLREPSSSLVPPSLRSGTTSDRLAGAIPPPARPSDPAARYTPVSSQRSPASHGGRVRSSFHTSRETPRPYQLGTTQPTGALIEAEKPTESARAPRWLRLGAVPLLLGALGLAGATIVALRPRSHPPPAPPAVATAAFSGSTTLASLPAPRGCTPEATAAVLSGTRLMREGSYEQAVQRFTSASDSDPRCAAAQMRVAVTGHYFVLPARSRAAFQRAVELRADLSERDQGLLDAHEPLLLRDPPDRGGLSARVIELAARFPEDAEIAMLAASESRAPLDVRLAYARRAVKIDPAYSDGWQSLGKLLELAGRDEEALAALERCIAVAPLSTDCLWQRIGMFRARGRCDAMESDARQMIAKNPSTSKGYELLASALAAQDSPSQAVKEALRLRWDKLADEERPEAQLFEGAALAALAGDFDAAEASASALAHLVDPGSELSPHVRPAELRIELRIEAGQLAEAAKLAAEFAGRARAWERKLDPFASTMRDDMYDEARLYALSRDVGALSPEAFDGEMRRFRERTLKSSYRADDRTLWAITRAMPARDGREAGAAIDAFPGGLSLAPAGAAGAPEGSLFVAPLTFRSAGFPYAFTGRALLLAGQIDTAIGYLRRGASACTALLDPFLHTRAHLWLGQALQQKGEKGAACEAFGVVLKRWGSAKPRSSTAADALRAARALRCPSVMK